MPEGRGHGETESKVIADNPFRHFMADELSLRAYLRGEKSINEKRLVAHLIAAAHINRYEIPDHYYERWLTETCQATHKITLKDAFTRVLPKMAGEYLVCEPNGRVKVEKGHWNDWQLLIRSFSPLVLTALMWTKSKAADYTQLDATALPTAHIKGDICDVHLHLNHGAEADQVWCDILNQPSAYIRYHRLYHNVELFKAQTFITSYIELYRLVCKAKALLMGMLHATGQHIPIRWTLAEQARLIVSVIKKGGEKLLGQLHFYLLIMGCMRRFLVVSAHQTGLVQFGHTLHQPFRGPEQYHNGRLLKQILGGNIQGVRHIEMRLNASEIKYIRGLRQGLKVIDSPLELSFLCHYIKGQSQKNDTRHILLHRSLLTGVDTAGKDFKAKPAKYKEPYLQLQKAGIRNFTYHAGEDFYHILDGLRTIYDAIRLLPLSRIGHASAAGVSPTLWASHMEGKVPVRTDEYRDALQMAIDLGVCPYKKKDIERRIKELEGEKLITVPCFEVLDADDIERLQKAILRMIDERNIVIEATPTSNITIGHAHSFQSYHLATWLRWKYIDLLDVPPIVLGSDEVGVFPTNILNEYANVEEMLCRDPAFDGLDELVDKIMDDIKTDSKRYTFT